MKLQTVLSAQDIQAALARAQQDNRVLVGVELVQLTEIGTKSRPHGYDVQLGCQTRTRLPNGKLRRFKNTGMDGSGSLWAASYDEHGHWMAEVFAADPSAILAPYKSAADFHAKTNNAYQLPANDLGIAGGATL